MADRMITVSIDKTASLDSDYLGIQGEVITLDIVLPAGLWALGYDGYLDFLLPDGLTYFKGPYDCSTGTISLSLGALDSILDKDGKVSWQFVLAETSGTTRTGKWKSKVYKSYVLPSVGATSSAILPYVPQMVYPDDYPASLISVADAGGNWAGNDVEAVLAEVLLKCWPVGSIYVGVGDTSPATLFGGTWAVFGAGKVMVGIDSTDTDFDAVEETRGAKTVTLDTTMIPAHTHTTSFRTNASAFGDSAVAVSSATGSAANTDYFNGSTGGGLAHNNIQPSIVVRMWKRVS